MPNITLDEVSETGCLRVLVTTPKAELHAFLCDTQNAAMLSQRLRQAMRETLDDYENTRARAVAAAQTLGG